MSEYGNNRHKFKDLGGKLNVTGSIINEYRIKNGLSAEQLSNKLLLMGLDIHRHSIYLIESGKRTITDYELALICEVLKITPNELLSKFTKYIKDNK